jgi:glycosyltransferase involved in cell wall biosynthesis
MPSSEHFDMRVAFDHRIFSYERHGGISRYITRLAAGLDNLQAEVRVFAPIHCNEHLSELEPRLVDGQRIDHYPPKTKRLFLALNYLRARRVIRQWRPDVVHETYYGAHSTAAPRCKTVLTIHDMIHELFPRDFPAWDNVARLKRKAVARADHIICVSENTRRDLIRILGVPETKVSVVLHGIDAPRSLSKAQPPDRPGLPYLLYVGNRRGYKNFASLLKAVAASQRLRSDVAIVAFGGGRFTNRELALMRELSLDVDRITQVAGDDDVLHRHYLGATALVYPSVYEGFGLPPLEAMARGCPVASSRAASMPEVLGDAAEFFDPASIEEMTSAIERVVFSSECAGRLRARGKIRAGQFSWQHCAAQTLAVYNSLLA